MTTPQSYRQFVRYWARKSATEYREAVALPGSQRFDLDEIEARLEAELKIDPSAKFWSIPQMAKDIVKAADRSRRPLVGDDDQGDLFRNEHKWIPLGGKWRVRWCDSTPFDLTAWLGIVNETRRRQDNAANNKVSLIQATLDGLLSTGSANIGAMWRSEYGWEPSEPDDDDDIGPDDTGDDGDDGDEDA